MSKEEFLRELERKLHVLNEQERRDVLEDYAQHIDLKIRSGQTEEEAVHSLGDPGELAAELLDVYHINSEYASDSHAPENAGGDPREDLAQKTGRKAGPVRKLRGRIAASSEAGREQREAVRMQKREERRIKKEARMKIRKERKKMDGKQREYRPQGNMVSRALAYLGSLIRACILLFWKACLFGIAFPAVLLGAFCLFLGGIVLVLLLQGYPLAGVGIGLLGLTMSSFGLAALILSWVFTGKKDRPAQTARNREPACAAFQGAAAGTRQMEYPSAGAAARTAEKTAEEKEQGRERTSDAAQSAKEDVWQPDHGQKFTEKTTDETGE